MKMPSVRPGPDSKLGMCLAGGGGLGFLHIGLFDAMAELGIRADVVAGTSMGAVMGAFYAAEKTPDEMRRMLREFRWARVVALTLRRSGILSTSAMQAFLRDSLGDVDIADLPIRLKISALDLHTGELRVFTEGPLARCLAASCAVPGLFEPVEIEGYEYFDAGSLYNLPLELLSGEGTERIIAGNTIGRYGLQRDPRSVEEILYQAYLVGIMNLSLRRVGGAGWEGRESEELIFIDYHTHGANPARLDECRGLIEETHRLALAELEPLFGRKRRGAGRSSEE